MENHFVSGICKAESITDLLENARFDRADILKVGLIAAYLYQQDIEVTNYRLKEMQK